jgi:acyl-CoA thioester hydrolase
MSGSAPHLHTVRVRYAESDQMGLAHHSAYVDWFEEARIEFMRSRGVIYRELEAQGILMPVIAVEVAYKRSVRFDDVLDLETTVELKGPGRLTFTTQVKERGSALTVARGQVTVVATSRDGKPIRLPQAVGQLIGAVPSR